MSDPIKIVIADSFEIVREGITARLGLADGMSVVGEAEDGFGALKLCRQLQPDVLLMDLGLTRPSGAETLEKIRKSCPDTMVIVLSSDNTFAKLFYVLSQGAVGFMPKQAKGADFVSAIRAAANGYTHLPIDFLEDFVQTRHNLSRTGNAFGLSPREVEILDACTAGQSNKEIARLMNISVRTVETHRNSIYRKTSCSSVEDLSRICSAVG